MRFKKICWDFNWIVFFLSFWKEKNNKFGTYLYHFDEFVESLRIADKFVFGSMLRVYTLPHKLFYICEQSMNWKGKKKSDSIENQRFHRPLEWCNWFICMLILCLTQITVINAILKWSIFERFHKTSELLLSK